MKFELEVVRFNTTDVVTTSGEQECPCETCEVIFEGDIL